MPASRPRLLVTFVALLTLVACDRVTTVSPPGPGVFPLGDPILGRIAFEDQCAGCHVTRDGFDIAFFGFGNETILAEAEAQVDSATALDIVAYISSLGVRPTDGREGLFQPAGQVLSSDVDLAQRLFGGDEWPEDLTTQALLALDPRNLPVAVPFPVWSLRDSNLHWMPEAPLDPTIREHGGGQVRTALDAYYRTGSRDALIQAISTLRSAERDADSEAAPCVMSPLERLDASRCFETRRWIASLGAQFMLRAGTASWFERAVHDSWWDVGNAARQSIRRGEPVADAQENWVQWMYLGWSFEPGRHSSFYLADGLDELGLPRHAAYHTLRSMVARSAGSWLPYEDVTNTARFAPDHWVYSAVLHGYRHLLERLGNEDRPVGDARETAVYHTLLSYQIAAGRIGSGGDRKRLRALRNEILERLD